ncbi:AAA family ATPase [Sinorhizobium medicae]|nr:AAA family ATPase [Sinorhizobium medicae]
MGYRLKINNCGRGIHKNEIEGVEALRDKLPSDWYAFTNLDLVIDAGTAREIDVILITHRRVLVLDLKKWSGKITGSDGHWQLDGQDMGPSPVSKICDVERNLYILLKEELAKHPQTRKLPIPKITGLAVLLRNADRSGIPVGERKKVMFLEELLRTLDNDNAERSAFGNVAAEFLATPLTDSFWKQRLTKFFNAGATSPLQPGRRKFERFVPEDDPDFEHPKKIYSEYNAREEGTPPNLGTLRLWDFSAVEDGRFQSEDGRREIAGRERRVYHWLRDRSESLEKYILAPKTDDPSSGVRYWEIYDRRKKLKRLFDWVSTEHKATRSATRVELVRQLLTSLSEFHKVEAAHLDIGLHSIWLEAPTTVRISHLFVASHPDVRSLGPDRYNFLASVQSPEDILQEKSRNPVRKDVYLAGVAAHCILFGMPPEGEPPEWKPEVDETDEFAQLHHWLAQILDFDQAARFPNAKVALEAFNAATAERPTREEVRVGLERLTTSISSQRKLFAAFPIEGEPIKETSAVDIWRSNVNGENLLVKVWKQPSWGDFEKEGKRVLAFLERAAELKADRPKGVPEIREVLWLSDAFAIVQDWTEGASLSTALQSPPETWLAPEGAIAAAQALEARVSALHEASYPHGDLKPCNIVVGSNNDFTLIDFLDFSPQADGELQNRLYSSGGDGYERDRFAVLKISEQILSLAELPPEAGAKISLVIESCRTMSPRLSTLTPLAEALQACLDELRAPPSAPATTLEIKVSARGCTPGNLEPEEGLYHVRTYRRPGEGLKQVLVRGAFEELDFRVGDDGKVRYAIRRAITQTRIAIVERHESFSFEGIVAVTDSVSNEFSSVDQLLSSPGYLSAISDTPLEEGDVEEEYVSPLREEELEEGFAEERYSSSSLESPSDVDVPTLWRELIDSEKELTTESIAITDSGYDHSIRRHKVPMDLESGVFDFDRNDTVEVRKLQNGSWRRIGELDLERSTASAAFIDAYQYGLSGALVAAEQRLQFISHFETESLKRRAGAVDRTLAGLGRANGLVSVFNPATGALPTRITHVIEEQDLTDYELNADQRKALETIVSVRPVGLLQGPPGTGKTRFIAALAHYALTSGLAKNVLLSSQSHEAVNTAGEALLKLFRKSGGDPSALRVGMNEDQVSDEVRPFYTFRVEQALKDRFDSTYESKMITIGDVLGLPKPAAEDILAFERNVVPLSRRISDLAPAIDSSDPRIVGLLTTLAMFLQKLNLPGDLVELLKVEHELFLEQALEALIDKHRSLTVTPEKIARLRQAIRIGSDFVTSASTQFRSFEPFLAATRQIVMGTCVGLGRTSLGLIGTAFDLVSGRSRPVYSQRTAGSVAGGKMGCPGRRSSTAGTASSPGSGGPGSKHHAAASQRNQAQRFRAGFRKRLR